MKPFLYTQQASSMNNCNNLHLKFLWFLKCSFVKIILTKNESYMMANANILFDNETFPILLGQNCLFLVWMMEILFIQALFCVQSFESIRYRGVYRHFCFQPERMQTIKSLVYVPLWSDELGLSTCYLWYCVIYFFSLRPNNCYRTLLLSCTFQIIVLYS